MLQSILGDNGFLMQLLLAICTYIFYLRREFFYFIHNGTQHASSVLFIFCYCYDALLVVSLIRYFISHMVLIAYLLMELCEQFEGCPWDLGAKSSASCCCSCTSKLFFDYHPLCLLMTCGIWHIGLISGKTSNVRDSGNHQWVPESSSVRAYRGM